MNRVRHFVVFTACGFRWIATVCIEFGCPWLLDGYLNNVWMHRVVLCRLSRRIGVAMMCVRQLVVLIACAVCYATAVSLGCNRP